MFQKLSQKIGMTVFSFDTTMVKVWWRHHPEAHKTQWICSTDSHHRTLKGVQSFAIGLISVSSPVNSQFMPILGHTILTTWVLTCKWSADEWMKDYNLKFCSDVFYQQEIRKCSRAIGHHPPFWRKLKKKEKNTSLWKSVKLICTKQALSAGMSLQKNGGCCIGHSSCSLEWMVTWGYSLTLIVSAAILSFTRCCWTSTS